MFPTLVVDLIIGLPTKAGKMCSGKLEPAYPHFTNWKETVEKKKNPQSKCKDIYNIHLTLESEKYLLLKQHYKLSPTYYITPFYLLLLQSMFISVNCFSV